ncbi:unnamed protein product [Clonostachys rosea]|uniref:BTB domain-containing protein n=1 Tax=Bionectria ochroleuca TaxID=29856 RepID=A0ABY6URT0_BIOOC|nr:unnamed protein product [Clonostachys rosea]
MAFSTSLFGTPNKTDEPVKELTSSLQRLFKNESYSDLTILCGGSQYKVHRALICPRSSFFEAACRNNFKEAKTGEISLPDDDPVAVKMMIRYFYHLDYSPPGIKTASHQTPVQLSQASRPQASATPTHLVLHAQVYALGEKYGIPGLKALAATKFKNEVDQHWHSQDFLLALKEVYSSTVDHDRSLRDIVVQAVSAHLQLLETKDFQDAIKGLDLPYDLLINLKRIGRI